MPTALVCGFQVEPAFQRKGLGQRMMKLLEIACTKMNIAFVMTQYMVGDTISQQFFANKMKGYKED